MGAKDAGVRIRVEKGLRDEFLETCRRQDMPAAQVLRRFMRKFVAAHSEETADPGTKISGPPAGAKR